MHRTSQVPDYKMFLYLCCHYIMYLCSVLLQKCLLWPQLSRQRVNRGAAGMDIVHCVFASAAAGLSDLYIHAREFSFEKTIQRPNRGSLSLCNLHCAPYFGINLSLYNYTANPVTFPHSLFLSSFE